MNNLLRAVLSFVFTGLFTVISPVASATKKVTVYYWDATGSLVVATDENGNVLWCKKYKPYGKETQPSASSPINAASPAVCRNSSVDS